MEKPNSIADCIEQIKLVKQEIDKLNDSKMYLIGVLNGMLINGGYGIAAHPFFYTPESIEALKMRKLLVE